MASMDGDEVQALKTLPLIASEEENVSDGLEEISDVKIKPDNCEDRLAIEQNGRHSPCPSSASSSSSWTTTSCAPPQSLKKLTQISAAEARNRSFLVGSSHGWGSLLGAGQLDLTLPDRTLSLFVGTWNMNEIKEVNPQIGDFLLPPALQQLPDCYAIGTQENTLSKEEWEVTMQEVIGLTHVLLHAVVLGTLHLGIFVRRELIWFCSECEEATVATRQGTVIKTKGAVAAAVQIFGTSFLFVNSHLTAHEGHLKERISDYEKIREGLEFPRKKRSSDATSHFDCALWFGDLNFRIPLPRHEVLATLQGPSPDLSALLQVDQLTVTLKNGAAFSHFRESEIGFAPTFKYDVGTDAYDTSEKQRTPAYTDRILCRTKKKTAVSCLLYDSAPTVQMSDHKPVFALFQCQLRPGRDNIPLAAGLFNRSVYLKALTRRAANLDPNFVGQRGSRLCAVM